MPRMIRNENGLTEREQRFAELYVIDFDHAKAYVGAGFKAKNDDVAVRAGRKLLRRAPVASYIATLKANLSVKMQLDAALTIDEHLCIAHVVASDIWDVTGDQWAPKAPKDIPKRALRAIKSVKVRTTKSIKKNGDEVEFTETEIVLHDKLAALTTQLKMTGQLRERSEMLVGGVPGRPVEVIEVVRSKPKSILPAISFRGTDIEVLTNGSNGNGNN